MFSFEPGVALWALISFACVLFIIQRYILPPLRSTLDTRQRTLEGNLNEAQRLRLEAEKSSKSLEERMRWIQREENRILTEAHEKGKGIRADYERRALEEFRAMRMQRERELAKMEEGFMEQTRQDFLRLVIGTCERILKTGLTPDQQNRILEERIRLFETMRKL